MTDLKNIPVDKLREHRLAKEREWYLSEDGFLDYARECGAAPLAQFEPHGRYSNDILKWRSHKDPESGKDIFVYKLVLWPRGSFKSSVFDVGYVTWLIAKNPNIRILVCSETGKQARKFVELAKAIIDSEWYKERFGVHRGKTKWTNGSFTSALRTDKHTKEATLQAAGVGEVWTGSHWDFTLFDDVVSQENTKTEEGIASLNNWFGEILAQLDPGCRLLIIGTLHHFADLYCTLLKNPKIKRLFDCSIHSWKNQDGTLFFPGRLTTAFIEQQKLLMSPRLFACFYENRPFTEDQQLFKPEYFRVIRDEEVPSSVWSYIMTDFAFITDEKKSGKPDRTAFWVVALDCNRVAYVLDFYVGRWKPSDSVRIACDLWNRYQRFNLKGMSVEDTTHKEVLMAVFEEVRRQTFIRPKIISIAGRSQESKGYRIESIEPRFRRGDIYFVQSLKEQFARKWRPLVDEMTEWPFSAHDDIPDAISDIDKMDKDGKHYCPAPPAGWRVAVPIRNVPTLINGRMNPELSYPADEMHKTPTAAIGSDLWATGSSKADVQRKGQTGNHNDSRFPSDPNNDLFSRRSR